MLRSRAVSPSGFHLAATAGTAAFLERHGLEVRTMLKVHEARPHVVDHLINGEIALVVNTPLGQASHEDDGAIRRTALKYDIPCITTLSGAMAAAEGIAALQRDGLGVRPLQEVHKGMAAVVPAVRALQPEGSQRGLLLRPLLDTTPRRQLMANKYSDPQREPRQVVPAARLLAAPLRCPRAHRAQAA